MINVFIIGSKGIPARYGGFETFVENLTQRKNDPRLQYFVSCMGPKGEKTYNGALCFSLPTPFPGPVGRILHVSNALSWTESYVANHEQDDQNIVYILGCRIGPLLKKHVLRLHRLRCIVVCNPDGLEWKRGKWNSVEKRILKYCEKKLVINSDFIVCDSIGIRDYLTQEYKRLNKARMVYIAYGCDISASRCEPSTYHRWIEQNNISKEGYYLVVGRFVPENNLYLIIREFMASKTRKDLVIVTNVENNKFYKKIKKGLNFGKDSRIKFVGTVYDQKLLVSIRENAFAYIHGHSVGGTNPSLLEALGYTKINLLYDVSFNREVGEDQALYFSQANGSLSGLISFVEDKRPSFSCKEIIQNRYSWNKIVSLYETFFLSLPIIK